MIKGEVTVILNVYNRSYSLETQLDAIKNQTVPVKDENIWIFYNKGTEKQSAPKNPAHRIFVCNQNTKFHGRFAIAMLVKTEYVSFFDDDVIPGKKWFENCLNTLKTHNGLLGGSGVTIKSKGYQWNNKHGWNGAHLNEPVRVDLVGHGLFLKSELLKNMWLEEPYSWDNAEDIMFAYLCQKYGKVNTYVPPHPENDLEMWCNIDGGKMGNDKNATYIHSVNHYKLRDETCVYCIDNGWNTVNNIK